MPPSHPLVCLIDVDNTLLDNDGIQNDLKDHLEQTYGSAARERYWRILEDLFAELGYRDYLERCSATGRNILARWNCWPCHPSSSTTLLQPACSREPLTY